MPARLVFRAFVTAWPALFLLAACTAPRSITVPAQTTPQGHVRMGAAMVGNLPTQTAEALYTGLEDGILTLYERVRDDSADVAITADSLNTFVRALIAYSLDPLGFGQDFYFRYGAFPRLDGGYRYAGGAHVFDARWQFFGPLASDSAGGWAGSIGLQVSSQSFELPDVVGLDKLQEILRFEFNRKDLVIPLVFGRPFGKQGRIGDIGMGFVYDLAVIKYGTEIRGLVERNVDGTTEAFGKLEGDRAISAYGGFVNLRLGYRYVFALLALSIYGQDYGEYELFGGEKTKLGGVTVLPSFGLEARF